MTRAEFTAATGIDLCSDVYHSEIEPVYMYYARFDTKESFYNFVKTFGLSRVHRMNDILTAVSAAINDIDLSVNSERANYRRFIDTIEVLEAILSRFRESGMQECVIESVQTTISAVYGQKFDAFERMHALQNEAHELAEKNGISVKFNIIDG